MNIPDKNLLSACELAFREAGEEVSALSELVGAPARVFSFSNNQRDYSFFAVDLIFREDGAVVLQEANGSNGASTGMLADGQTRRAHHMAEAALFRWSDTPWVAILAYANKTSLKAEFHARAALFTHQLVLSGVGRVRERLGTETLGDEEVSIVIGSISSILDQLTIRAGVLLYQGRRVGFATNANLIPALVRSGKVHRTRDGFNFDPAIFHEGSQGVEIALDKVKQQLAAVGTGITALRHKECPTWTEAITEIRAWHNEGMIPVAKISNGSQGIGIAFFPLSRPELVETEVRRMREEALSAYGPQADTTALPVALFEFAPSTPYHMSDGPHLWDIRVECQISPGTTTLIPDTVRVCPGVFDVSTFSRDGVLSNLSGRGGGLTFVRTPFALHDAERTELAWAGVSDSKFSAAMASLARWCEQALHQELYTETQPDGGKHEPT